MDEKALTHLKQCDCSILARAELIDKIRWAEHLTHKQTVSLAGYMDSYEVDSGETILHEGGADAHMGLVASGSVEILKGGITAGAKPVATLGPGQSFGEMSLIDGRPRSASAIAASSVSLLMLSKEDFTRLGEEDPRLAVAVFFKLATLMSQHLRETTGRLVEHL